MLMVFDRLRKQTTQLSEANAFHEREQLFCKEVLNILCLLEEYLTMHKSDTGTCEELLTSDKNQIF